jgi:hypothetical protein
MAKDYGVRARRRLTGGQLVTLGLAALLFLAVAGWLYGGSALRRRTEALARAQEAAIEGPPCPQLTAAQFAARGMKAPKGVLYEDVVFYRQFGHMSCHALRYGAGWGNRVYPVCQFTSPNALRVTTAKGDWYFAPGFGQPATVGAPHGLARCVRAANFTMNRLTRGE